MHAVIFEAMPKPGHLDAYLALAGSLRPALEQVDGFLDNRRFRSQRRPGWLLSLSTWRDEAALLRWRGHEPHRAAQRQGRQQIFQDYRLRVGRMRDGDAATAAGPLLTIVEGRRPAGMSADDPPADLAAALSGLSDLPGWDLFAGLQAPDDLLLLLDWEGGAASGTRPGRAVDVLRDYGLSRREQAPAGAGR